MLKFVKGEGVKLIDPESKLIPILKADGWKLEGAEDKADKEPNERDLLKAKADELGLEYAKNISTDKLKALVDDNS